MRFLTALTLIAYSVASLGLERKYSGDWSVPNQAIGIMLGACYVWLASRKNRPAVLTSFFQIYTWFGMMISAFVISTGEYMTEIEKVGSANGTFWVLFIFFVSGMEMTLLGYRAARCRPRVLRLGNAIERLTLLFATVPTLLLSAYTFFLYRGPILTGTSRTTFWGAMAPAYLRFIPNLVNQTFFFPAYAFLDAKEQGKPAHLGLALIASYALITIFVLGEKFTAFVVFANAFLFILAAKFPDIKIRPAYLFLVGSAAAVVFATISYTYIRDGYGAGFVLTRIALQAQLLWSAMEDRSALRLLPTDPSCFLSCSDFSTGQDYISWLYLPSARFEHYANVGSKLSGFTPALHLITLGWAISLSVFLLAAFALGWIQRKGITALSRRNLVLGFLYFKLHFGVSVFVSTANMVTMTGIVAAAICITVYKICLAKPETASDQMSGKSQKL